MDKNFNITTEENIFGLPTTTPSEEVWNGMYDAFPFAVETQDEPILRVPPPTKPNPIGDALCPLLLLAAFYFSLVYLKITKNRKTRERSVNNI